MLNYSLIIFELMKNKLKLCVSKGGREVMKLSIVVRMGSLYNLYEGQGLVYENEDIASENEWGRRLYEYDDHTALVLSVSE